MNFGSAIEANAKASEVMQPSEGSFRDPAEDAQSAPVRFTPLRQVRVDPSIAQFLPMWFRIIGSIRIDLVRTMFGMARFAGHRRNGLNQWNELSHIMPVCSGQRITQRDSVSVCENVVLAAGFAAIRRVWAGFFASSDGPHRGAIHRRARPVDQVRRADDSATRDATCPTHPPPAIPSIDASTTFRCHTPFPEAAFPKGYHFSKRTRFPSTPSGYPVSVDRLADWEHASGSTAPQRPTTHQRPMARPFLNSSLNNQDSKSTRLK